MSRTQQPAERTAPDHASATPAHARVLRLPELDDSAVPGARFARRAVVLTLGGVLALVLLIGVAVEFLTVSVTVDAVGSLEPDRVWPVRPNVAGTITAVLVRAGDSVHAGQPLLRLDTISPALALVELEAEAAKQRLDRERLALSAPIERAEVEAVVMQATARLLRTRAVLRERLADFRLGGDVDSVLAAYVRGTHVGLDAAVADVDAARSDVALARAQRARVALAPLERAKQAHEAARLSAQVTAGRVALTQRLLTAPAPGVILTEQTEQALGAVVSPGEMVLEIADAGRWRATVAVRERDVPRVRVGDRATVEIAALTALRDEPVRARVISVAVEPLGAGDTRTPPSAAQLPDARPRSYRVVLALDHGQLESLGLVTVRRGYGVRATIVTRRERAAVLVREWLRERFGGSE